MCESPHCAFHVLQSAQNKVHNCRKQVDTSRAMATSATQVPKATVSLIEAEHQLEERKDEFARHGLNLKVCVREKVFGCMRILLK